MHTALVFELAAVEKAIVQAAKMVVMNKASDLTWVPNDSWSASIVGVTLNNPVSGLARYLGTGHYWFEGFGAAEVTNAPVQAAEVRQWSETYRDSFFKAAKRGAPEAMTFLDEMQRNTARVWDNIKLRFEDARRINEEVRETINQGIDNTYRVKVLADISFMVVGSFVPGMSLAYSLGSGLAYKVMCDLAQGKAQAHDAGLVGYSAGAVWDTRTDVITSVATEQATQLMMQEAEDFATRQMVYYTALLNRFTRQPGGPSYMQQLALQQAGKGALQAEEEVAKRAASLGRAMTGVGLLVGLWSMREDITTAIVGYSRSEEGARDR